MNTVRTIPTILNVDDDEVSRYIKSRILRRAGFEIEEVATGEEALKAVAAIAPDLVLLDVHLPDINGLEVCKQIKANPATASIPVLHLSAIFIKGADRAQGLEGGADGYLTEPVEPAELVAAVRALLRIRQAEAQVRAAAQQWQATFDALSDGVALLDAGGKVLRCNRAFAGIFGKSCSDTVGCGYWELVPEAAAPAGEESPEQLLANYPARDVSVGDRWFRASADPVTDEANGFSGAVYILSDITDRKRAEAELTQYKDCLEELVAKRNSQLVETLTQLRQEIAERERAEEERTQLLIRERQARAAAEEANELKDRFLALVSHELRTPLTPILGWAKLLRGAYFNETTTAHALETIERNACQLVRLVEDLLDVSRMIAGKMSMQVYPVNLASTIGAAVDTMRMSAEGKSIQIESFLDAREAIVEGDASRLQQVICNLLSNAIKFTPDGGRVEVRLSRVDSCAEIQVSDTGIGVSPDFLPHIFDRFRQADSSTTKRYGGLGLGLAIARHLVERHGGTISATSPGIGEGTTFTVRLPLLKYGVEDNWTNPAEKPDSLSPKSCNSLGLLLVNGNADARSFFSKNFKNYGIN